MTPDEAVAHVSEKVKRASERKAQGIDVDVEALRVLLAERDALREAQARCSECQQRERTERESRQYHADVAEGRRILLKALKGADDRG
jgi:hypothetical protein